MSRVVAVSNALVTAVAGAEYWPIVRNPNTGLFQRAEEALTVTPSEVFAAELSSTYQTAPGGRSLKVNQAAWFWGVRIMFPERVEASNLPTVIPVALDGRDVTMLLQSVTFEHPPEQSPPNGTRLEIIYAAFPPQFRS